MRNIPTDLEILNAIYEKYYETFVSFLDENKTRKAFIPIDIASMAEEMNVEPDVIFGRLYYHLEKKYGYKNDDGSKVSLFTMQAGGDVNCIHFPYLTSILADMRNEDKKYQRAITFSIISAVVSVVSLALSLITFFKK
jgi:hypothetical protein